MSDSWPVTWLATSCVVHPSQRVGFFQSLGLIERINASNWLSSSVNPATTSSRGNVMKFPSYLRAVSMYLHHGDGVPSTWHQSRREKTLQHELDGAADFG